MTYCSPSVFEPTEFVSVTNGNQTWEITMNLIGDGTPIVVILEVTV